MKLPAIGVVLFVGLATPAGGLVRALDADLRQWGERIVPQVRLVDDAAFFAAWNLEHPGLEAVRAAVAARDFARAKVELKRHFLERRQPRWRVNFWEMPAKPQGNADRHSRFKAGEDVLAHKFSAGGFEVTFGPKIDWNHFPLTLPNGQPDTEYPVIHSLNRFQHFSRVLGPLYWFSHDERYAREFVAQVTDHVLSNPAPEHYIRGTAVWSRLTACSPLNGAWLDAYNYFLPSESFTPEAHAVMLKGFLEKARYAVRAPDAVNRYITQLSGIYTVGAYFPEWKQAADFRAYAAAAMARAAREEFYPDKITKELCPGYHGASRSSLNRIVEIARLMGYTVEPELDQAVKSTYEFYPQVATPLGGLPNFGDSWGPAYGSLQKTFAAVKGRWNEPVFDWFATGGAEGRPPQFTSTRLPWAGFYVMRSGWDRNALWLCMDAGPMGKDHWHEDYNNFECYAYGEHLIAEVGVYSYTYSKWNQYFKSSLSHNVVTVDGYSQKRGGRGPRVTDHPRTNDWHSDAAMDLAWGFYDGPWSDFMDYRGQRTVKLPATHRRDIAFVKPSYWILCDRLACPGQHAYEQLFHFLPDRTVKVTAPGRVATVDAGRANIAIVQVDPERAAQVIVGREDPPQGWFSPAGGKREPAPAASFGQTAAETARYDTLLVPSPAGKTPELRVERVPCTDETGGAISADDVCALRITTPAGTDYYIDDLRQQEIGPPAGRVKRAGPVETDGRAALVRLDGEGRVIASSVAGGKQLRYRDAAIK